MKKKTELPRYHDFLSDIGPKLFPPSHRFLVVFIVFPLAEGRDLGLGYLGGGTERYGPSWPIPCIFGSKSHLFSIVFPQSSDQRCLARCWLFTAMAPTALREGLVGGIHHHLNIPETMLFCRGSTYIWVRGMGL